MTRAETITHISSVTSQPFTLEYTCSKNKKRRYTPDFLVEFDLKIWPYKPPHLIEVKPKKFINELLLSEKAKIRTAFQFCRENDYVFHFIDEDKIRDQRFLNVKF